MKRLLLIGCFCLMGWISLANHILIPMDNTQSNHLMRTDERNVC